jgi:hypothetical protein
MGLKWPEAHPSHVQEYQLSGIPWVTTSIISANETREIQFDSVTRDITVKNNTASTTVAVAFTENGLKPGNANFFYLNGSDSLSEPIRCSKLFVSSSLGEPEISVIASLTCIKANLLVITGSYGYQGVG